MKNYMKYLKSFDMDLYIECGSPAKYIEARMKELKGSPQKAYERAQEEIEAYMEYANNGYEVA